MKRVLSLAALLYGFIFFSVLLSLSESPAQARGVVIPTEQPDDETAAIEQAIRDAIHQQNEAILAYLVYDEEIFDIRISADQLWARAGLGLNDPDSGEPLPSEPGLVLVKKMDDTWEAILPADAGWLEAVHSAPEDLLSAEEKSAWIEAFQKFEAQLPATALTGYLLPWAAGETRSLSQSLFHDYYTPSGTAHYAFDFYIHDTMWNIYASKAGTVWRFKYDVPTCYDYHCDQPLGNYIVLQDTTTSPTSYQLYLHLAYDSIPDYLRVVGTQVQQGQLLGIADNTGQSYGDHLHFQVHTNPDSYWGQSVDIRFDDVFINDGRPRTAYEVEHAEVWCHNPDFPPDVCNQSQLSYVSLNPIHEDVVPPEGGILEPYNGTTISSQTVHLSGWAIDDGSGLYSAQFIARYNDGWQNVGDSFATSLFSLDWDLCGGGVPDGPVSLALELKDYEGNTTTDLPGLTQLIKNYDCPQPVVCTAGPNQVALFADSSYSGACSVLEIGDYPDGATLGAPGDNNVESIQVGSNVEASLFSDPNYAGRSETSLSNDSNLVDNLTGGNQLTSLKVMLRSQLPLAPASLVYPLANSAFPTNASVSLSWRPSSGAVEFQVSLTGPIGGYASAPAQEILSPWLSDPVWHLNDLGLLPGTYQWKVKARNLQQIESGWSGSRTFYLTIPVPDVDPVTAPFTDDLESYAPGWAISGLWSLVNTDLSHSPTHSFYYGDNSADYDNGYPNSGDLTSPPISMPVTSTTYLLSFWSLAQTESSGADWDQRWLQISQDSGPFQNILQLSDDPAGYWVNPKIDLSPYAGATIQIRFHFETLDSLYNDFTGWYLDDFTITMDVQPGCADADNSPEQATLLLYGDTKEGMICPSGDQDFFKFNGTAGDRIAVDITTQLHEPPPEMDLILFLLDDDTGHSLLAEHDDEIPMVRKDPHLGYRLPRSGTYYLKNRAWDHPSFGSETLTYTLNLVTDDMDPLGALTFPGDSTFIPIQPFSVTVGAGDDGSGVSHVEFWWHSNDWSGDDWEVLGSDWVGEDGWAVTFDPAELDEGTGMAFFANIYDWAGNWAGSGAWNLGLDRTPPVSALEPITLPVDNTAIRLSWTASDNLSGLDHFELQSKKGTGGWEDIQPDPGGSTTETWFIGDAGNTYNFWMRAVDRAANVEAYPAAAERSAAIPTAAQLCSSPDQWDVSGNDNSPAAAKPFAVSAPAQTHNLCNPLSADFLNDEDWVTFTATKDTVYLLEATPQSESTAAVLELYAADGVTLLDSYTPQSFGEGSSFFWKAGSTGKVYLRARHLDGRVIGNAVSYQLRVSYYFTYFLPLGAKQ